MFPFYCYFSSYQLFRKQIREKQFFTTFFPLFFIFIISLLTNFSLSANTRKTIVPSPPRPRFSIFSPFSLPKKAIFKNALYEFNERWNQSEGDRRTGISTDRRVQEITIGPVVIGLKSRRRSFFLQASAAPVYKGAAIPVALHAIKS